MVALYVLSAFLCPVWIYEDPGLGGGDPRSPSLAPGLTKRGLALLLLAAMPLAYAALVHGQLRRLPAAS
ncbi:hypothetical protein WJX74_004851 [Apatococcus lobatus]|uniref:Uncharacterized protein n=1 Tax=Apatococcus lobatus TaxID=904363 RepID=A0AAW1SGG1_9CHLO